jgi:hypothetical protein
MKSSQLVLVFLLGLVATTGSAIVLPEEPAGAVASTEPSAESVSSEPLAGGVSPTAVGDALNVAFTGRILYGSAHAVKFRTIGANDYALVALGPTLMIYDVTTPTNPVLVGRFDAGDVIEAIDSAGNYAYLAAGSAGLAIVNVSSPAAPSLTGSYATSSSALDVVVSGSLVYVAASLQGLLIVNVSTPSSPTLTKLVDTPGAAYGVAIAGTHAYVSDHTSLQIVDVATPASAAIVGSTTFAPDGGVSEGIAVSGYYAYVANVGYGLEVVDISNPASPSRVAVYDTPGSAYDVVISGLYAYVADHGSGLRIVDISFPLVPVSAGTYNTSGLSLDVSLEGSTYAYVADGSRGLRVIDISNPAAPSEVGSRDDASGGVSDLAVQGEYAYVADASRGLRIVDVGNPSNPVAFNWALGSVYAVAADEGFAYAGTITGLQVLDVSTPASPAYLGYVSLPTSAGSIALEGHYLYATVGSNGLRVVDVATPASPTIVGTLDTPGEAYQVVASGNTAYVADGAAGFQIVDISVPTAPVIGATVDTPGPAFGVALAGTKLFVADNSYVRAYDVSIRTNPVPLGSWATSASASRITVSGNFAYITEDMKGVRVLDVSNPAAMTEVGYYVTPGKPDSIVMSGGYLFAGHDQGGLWILRHTAGCADPYESNESWSEAAGPLSTGIWYQPRMCSPSDLDYFALDLTAHGTISLAMKPPAGKDYDLFLYDPNRNLVASSVNPAGQNETISYLGKTNGSYRVLVAGFNGSYSTTDAYALSYGFAACPTIAHPVYLPIVTQDLAGHPILHIQDPNDPGTTGVTGYNIYRDVVPNPATWTRIAANVVDMDAGTANVQYVDQTVSGTTYYFKVSAANGACDVEGPINP